VRDAPLTRDQILIIGGMMATLALAALDATVVGTALPTIVGQLGGLHLLGWVFSAYLLTSTVAVPFAAKLSDMIGRRPVYMTALAIFLAASVACGFATSMPMLIVLRAIQGIGGGALTTAAFTIIGDAFAPRQRARVQALFGAVWAVSSVLGPALGGLITTTVGWPWVFEINLPVGLLAGAVVAKVLHERVERQARRLDWAGGLLLTAAVVCLLLAVSQVPAMFGWVSPPTIGMALGAIVLLALFVHVERRVPEPIVALEHLRHRIIRPGLIVQALGGFILFGMTSFVPPMVQGVHGKSAFEAGLVVGTLTIGWPVGSFVGGRALIRWGARAVVLVGAALAMIGTAVLTQLQAFEAWWIAALGPVITGLGIGAMSVTVMVTVQSAVDWRERGVVTGLTQFSRTIAGTVGVGVMGGILVGFVGTTSSEILDPAARAAMSAADLDLSRASLATGLTWIYWTMFAIAAAMLVAVVRTMPDVRLGPGREVEVRSASTDDLRSVRR
jgi:EmrB/QacA subfamily drug resistance transporter